MNSQGKGINKTIMKGGVGNRTLIEYALTLYPESSLSRSDSFYQIIGMLERFISNMISFEEASAYSSSISGTSQPVEKIRDILKICTEPMPPASANKPPENEPEVAEGSRKKSRCWTAQEDERLLAGIHRFGSDNWTSISRFVGNGRTRSQCSQRWYRGLDPHLSKEQWNVAEESLLLQLVQLYGDRSWTQIAAKIGNRSDVQCRYKYKQMMKDKLLQSKSSFERKNPSGSNSIEGENEKQNSGEDGQVHVGKGIRKNFSTLLPMFNGPPYNPYFMNQHFIPGQMPGQMPFPYLGNYNPMFYNPYFYMVQGQALQKDENAGQQGEKNTTEENILPDVPITNKRQIHPSASTSALPSIPPKAIRREQQQEEPRIDIFTDPAKIDEQLVEELTKSIIPESTSESNSIFKDIAFEQDLFSYF